MRNNLYNHLIRQLKALRDEEPDNQKVMQMLNLLNGKPKREELLDVLNQLSNQPQKNSAGANDRFIDISSIKNMIDILYTN